MSPLVSVVIPTYNRKVAVLRAIESVVLQTYPSIEVIVVDDASTDGTVEALAAVDFPMPVQVVALSTNQGPGGARNDGIRRARGKYIALLDSDDRWLPTKLACQVEAAEAAADPENVVVCSQVEIRSPRETLIRPLEVNGAQEDIADYMFVKGGYVAPSCVLASAVAACNVTFRSGMRLHEDWDWYIRLQRQGATFVMLDKVHGILDDRTAEGRASRPQWEKSLAAAEMWRPMISERAYLAFRAKVAPQLRRTSPLRALSMISKAHARGAISTTYLLLLLSSVVYPGAMHLGRRLRGAFGASNRLTFPPRDVVGRPGFDQRAGS